MTRAGAYLLATVALVSYVSKADLSRTVVAVALPIMLLVTLTCRWSTRRIVQRRFARGTTLHRAVLVGQAAEVNALADHLSRSTAFGFSVIAAVVTSRRDFDPDCCVPTVDSPVEDLPRVVRDLGCDTIAVTSSGLQSRQLRELSWHLEGTGIQLVVAPAVTDIAGPRICIRPVDGLPLLYVDEPGWSGPRAVLKEVFERCFAAVLLATLAPLLLAIALAIKLTSRGPVLFEQLRPGLGNSTFNILKFRTMRTAPAEQALYVEVGATADPVKDRRDPRVTTVGRLLRRLSLDELPQLLNVLRGDMALVGPRPLISGVAARQDQVRRRLLMKPGMTGLWQVRGRSDLSWDERMRLDLYYVDNWSLTMDLMIMWKTVSAVLSGRGAY